MLLHRGGGGGACSCAGSCAGNGACSGVGDGAGSGAGDRKWKLKRSRYCNRKGMGGARADTHRS